MQSTAIFRAFFLTPWLVACAAHTLAAAELASPAEIVRRAALRGGLVVHIAGDAEPGRRTVAFRVDERFVVQGLERSGTRLAAARAYLRENSLSGPVSVLPWNGSRLPYADGLVNLLVIESEANLPSAEILRVLAPRGVAFVQVGDSWKRIAKPWPSDIDEWTHFLHGPDNNAVADDTRIEPLRYLQWIAGPRWARSHDHLSSVSGAVSANGRVVYVIDEGPTAAVTEPPEWKLVARDAFNGVLLWKKDLGRWEDPLRPFRSGPAELPRRLVAVGDRVYVTLGYGEPVSELDAATGEVLRTHAGTENTHEIIVADGRLHVVISVPLDEKSPTTGRVLRRLAPWRGGYDVFVTEYMPKHLRVIDAASGDLVWKKEGPDVVSILPLTLLVAEGKVLFQNPDHVVALDAKTGREAWRAARPSVRRRYAWGPPTLVVQDGVVLSADRAASLPVDTRSSNPKLEGPSKKAATGDGTASSGTSRGGGDEDERLEWRVSSNHLLVEGEIVAFAADSGRRLWSAPCHEGFNAPVDVLVVDKKVYSGVLAWGRQPGITKVYDLHTGDVVAERSPDQKTYTVGFGHARCYRHKATTKYVLLGRAGVEFVDLGADRVIADHWVRGACQYGILPANGLVYAPQHSCACYITAKLDGFIALSGRRSIAAADEPEQLEKGPAYGAVAARAVEPGGTAWATYRGDAARSGTTSTSVTAALGRGWERSLAGPLTAVVVADGSLFVAQREAHTLHALNAASGSSLWSFTAGGRIDSPPTIHAGRVYFGSADGWMVCLRATDGALVWRYRVAPEERQIVSWGQLESAWPVHGSVLVCDGPGGEPTAYAAAGRTSYVDGGVQLCAVNAATGEPLFRRRISHRDPATGHEPQKTVRGVTMPGAMPDVLSTDGTSLFMRHQRFDLEGQPLPQKVDHLYSSAGFLSGEWWHRTFLQVGRDMRGGYGGWMASGRQRASGRALVRRGSRVWGFGRKGYESTGSHVGLKSSHHLFAAELRTSPATTGRKGRKKPAGGLRPQSLWSQAISFYPRAMLVAGDTLFLAGPERIADFDAPAPKGKVWLWAVRAQDGTKLAAHELASAPVYDSMATADGRLYFTTVDGRVVCRK